MIPLVIIGARLLIGSVVLSGFGVMLTAVVVFITNVMLRKYVDISFKKLHQARELHGKFRRRMHEVSAEVAERNKKRPQSSRQDCKESANRKARKDDPDPHSYDLTVSTDDTKYEVLTVISWCAYPVVDLFPMFGITAAQAVVAIQITHYVPDIISKCGVGLVIYQITHDKSSKGALLGAMSAASPLELLKEAQEFKQQGNARFKEGEWRKALGSYHKVFCYINGLSLPGQKSEAASYGEMMGRSTSASQVPAEHVEEFKQLQLSTNLNMAACYLKIAEYQKCQTACGKALAVSGDSSKAYFRRGQANLELRDLDAARTDFEQARALAPEDPAVEKELKRLKVAFQRHEKQEKARFAKMFDKMAKDSRDDEGGEPAAPAAGSGDQEAAAASA
ncbi:unnamed protein product [Prorocentrum cordatum]|uniref:peptidylprolyl isomerase n=1 Tax=Prorocentrum cordatum TaxID=2364126 RepID=A0ABN9QNM6_9DINO|nr:unnamed protein product [Polarella glacialis]